MNDICIYVVQGVQCKLNFGWFREHNYYYHSNAHYSGVNATICILFDG